MSKIKTDFDPRKHGFHFNNGFVNVVCDTPFGKITTKGRCGGMAFAALDYYYARLPVPTHQGTDFPGGGVPPDHSRLADYIYNRLMDSFLQNGLKFISWTMKLDHYTVFYGDGVTKLTKEEEFPRLMARLANGPVALGLIKAEHLWEIGNNHQVVAYGAERDEATGVMTVYIYDNNDCDTEVTLTSDPSDPHFTSSGGDTYRGWFVEDYSPSYPSYIDLAVVKGLSISDPYPKVGDPLDCTYTVKNFGDFPSNIQTLNVDVVLPPGETPGAKFTPDTTATSIQPQQEHVFTKHCDLFARTKGQYILRISCLRVPDFRQDLLTAFNVGSFTAFIPTSVVSLDVQTFSKSIISPPPYVASIEAVYGTVTVGANNALKPCEQQQTKYRATWSATNPSIRQLQVFSAPIVPYPNKTLVFNIRFSTQVAMKKETVKLILTGKAADGSTVNVSVPLTGSKDFFTGTWTPQHKGTSNYRLTMSIVGADDVPRYPGRTPRGDVLDSQPQTIATVDTAAAGYPFRNYEPGTDSNYSIELAPLQNSMAKDSLESNDSFTAASPVVLSGATYEKMAWKSFNRLNFHSPTDQDFFSVKFESLSSDDTCTLAGPYREKLSDYLGLSVIHVPPWLGIVICAVGSCTDIDIYKIAPGPQLVKSLVKEHSYSLYNPVKVFPNKSLYAVLKNSNFPSQGLFAYDVWFGYAVSHDVYSVDTNAPAYRARPDIRRRLLKRYYDMIDLPRPSDDILNKATDSAYPYPANSLIITDKKISITKMQAFLTSAETLQDLNVIAPGQAQEVIADSFRNLGKIAQTGRLNTEAEGLFRASADRYAAAKLNENQVEVLKELVAFHETNGQTTQAADVKKLISKIKIR